MGIFLGLGSNLGNRAENLREASSRLQFTIVRSSRIYETEPVGFQNQPWFLNSVIHIETDLTPLLLLNRCQEIEQELGRTRTIRNGPRTIDIDLLFYNDEVIHSQELKLPHPEIPFRRFVLEPLSEIAPEFPHPILRLTPPQLLQVCPDHSVVRIYDETARVMVPVPEPQLPAIPESTEKTRDA